MNLLRNPAAAAAILLGLCSCGSLEQIKALHGETCLLLAEIRANTAAVQEATALIPRQTNAILESSRSVAENADVLRTSVDRLVSNTEAVSTSTASLRANTQEVRHAMRGVSENTAEIVRSTEHLRAQAASLALVRESIDANVKVLGAVHDWAEDHRGAVASASRLFDRLNAGLKDGGILRMWQGELPAWLPRALELAAALVLGFVVFLMLTPRIPRRRVKADVEDWKELLKRMAFDSVLYLVALLASVAAAAIAIQIGQWIIQP
jgi:hypothetical protein